MKIIIGIQARSGSTRLPGKAFKTIAGRMMLDRVIDTCNQASRFISARDNSKCSVLLLVPTGDPIIEEFGGRVDISEGAEFDVLARYAMAMELREPDYVIRITGDCPLSLSYVIDGVAKIGAREGYDYLSNGDERFRTSIDGLDCEWFSARMLKWAHEVAIDGCYDREHVTPLMRHHPPEWARCGTVINHLDLSDLKLSVDTQEDLERADRVFSSGLQKYQAALKVYGHGKVHRL